MNRRNKKEQGITLIALVVTIVVLLILAGVSIAMLTGENGIIKQAQEARRASKEAEIKEKVELAVIAAKSAGLGKIDIPTLNNELDKIGFTGEDIITLPSTITIENVKLTIGDNGNVKIEDSVENEDTDNAGDGGTADDKEESTEGTEEEIPAITTKTLAELKESEEVLEEDTKINDDNGDSLVIPKGFNIDDESPITVIEGIVIEDSYDNQYVWIPVFEKSDNRMWGIDYSSVTTAKTASTTSFTSDDFTNIKSALQSYAGYGLDSVAGSDIWFGDKNYGKYGYYDTNGNLVYYTNGNMTESEYNKLYNDMLVSVYKNGGFYIGRYEMGIGIATSVETAESLSRTSLTEYTSTITNEDNEAPTIEGMPTPISKENAVGYNYITQSQAQMLAEKMGEEYGYTDVTSSLMFGVQWNLVKVFIENYGAVSTGEPVWYASKLWGNFDSSTFIMDRGYYNIYNSGLTGWKEKSDVAKDGTNSERWLCTTGASEQNKMLNIYDFGGNLFEISLERDPADHGPVSLKGGSYYVPYADISTISVSYSFNFSDRISARPALWL